LHKKAVQLSKTLHPVYIVTSEAVLIEVLNDFSKRGEYFRDLAIELTQNLRSNPNVRIVPQTSEQFEQGLRLYQQRKDKAWSHTDCVSFKIMEENGIREALAYDKHFAQAGFTALMRNCRV
jgi:predicted nucleic acid-binding protein